MDFFVRALEDNTQRKDVWDKDPEGIEQVVAMVLRYEGVQRIEDQSKQENLTVKVASRK